MVLIGVRNVELGLSLAVDPVSVGMVAGMITEGETISLLKPNKYRLSRTNKLVNMLKAARSINPYAQMTAQKINPNGVMNLSVTLKFPSRMRKRRY